MLDGLKTHLMTTAVAVKTILVDGMGIGIEQLTELGSAVITMLGLMAIYYLRALGNEREKRLKDLIAKVEKKTGQYSQS